MRAAQLIGPSQLVAVEVGDSVDAAPHTGIGPGPEEPGCAGPRGTHPQEHAVSDLPGQVLVQVEVSGICGSDLEHFRLGPARSTSAMSGRPGFPGHEVLGTVVTSRSDRWRPGDRVVGWATGFDALAERVWTDAASLGPASPALPATVAVLAQPVACATHVAARLATMPGGLRGRHVTVLGLGPMGVLICAALDARGASVHAVDPVDRTEVARRAGARTVSVCTAEQWAQAVLLPPRGPAGEHDNCGRTAGLPDVVVEAVGHGHGPLVAALGAAADGGTVYAFGIPAHESMPLDVTGLVRRNLTLTGGTTQDRSTHLASATTWLEAHADLARDLVTDVFTLEDVQAAFERASDPDPARLKVVIDLRNPRTPSAQEVSL